MSILPAGTFKVSDYRKPMPERVKRQALTRTILLRFAPVVTQSGDPKELADSFWNYLKGMNVSAITGLMRFDHRPPLQDRPYDTTLRDFVPRQNDPEHIEAVPDCEHDARTFGAPGRTERGDADRRKRVRSLANKTENERERRAAKVGQKHERRDIPPPTKCSQKPKAKIRGRGFQKRPKAEKPHKPPVGRFS